MNVFRHLIVILLLVTVVPLVIGCGKAETSPVADPSKADYPGKEFAEKWCRNSSTSREAQLTVSKLLAIARETDCVKAGKTLARYDKFDLSGKGGKTSDLRPLESFPQLTALNLTDNEISDLGILAPLRNLKIKSLDLSYNSIKDVHGLEKWLPQLEEIVLDFNQIESADFAFFDKLRILMIRQNKLTRVPRFPNTLVTLNFEYNEVRTPESFQFLTPSSQLTEFRGLSTLPQTFNNSVKELQAMYPNATLH